MQKFIQYTPTEILFGENTQAEVGKEVKKWGGSRVFIVYGGGSVKKSGLLAQVEEALEKEGLAYEEFGGVKPNPRMAYAQEGVEKAIEFGADFLLAVGGGSSIDTAKAIAHGVANPDWSLEEIWGGEITLTRSTPGGCVLTIAAAGSETSDSAVLTNEETGKSELGGNAMHLSKDEQILYNHFEDMYNTAYNRGIPIFSDFVGLNGLELCYRLLDKNKVPDFIRPLISYMFIRRAAD